MGVLAYNLLHIMSRFCIKGVEVKRSMEWLIRRVIKAAARAAHHGRLWWLHVASAFLLAHHYRSVLDTA